MFRRRRRSLNPLAADEMRRQSGVNVCWGRGQAALLVNADWVIPELPEDFVWPAGNPSIGCNALCCGNCDARVRDRPNWRLAYGVGGSAFPQLYALADWRTAAAFWNSRALGPTYAGALGFS